MEVVGLDKTAECCGVCRPDSDQLLLAWTDFARAYDVTVSWRAISRRVRLFGGHLEFSRVPNDRRALRVLPIGDLQ